MNKESLLLEQTVFESTCEPLQKENFVPGGTASINGFCLPVAFCFARNHQEEKELVDIFGASI